MRTDPPSGDELTSMLTAMKTNLLRRADTSMKDFTPARRSRGRIVGITLALVGLLVAGSAGAALATGIIPSPFALNLVQTPTPTASPTPTPTETPTPTPTPTEIAPPVVEEPAPDLFSGYNARQLWDMCVTAGVQEFPGSVTTIDYDLKYLHLTPDGVPEIYISFDTPDTPMPTPVIWICQFGGDPSAPVLDYFSAKDL